MNTCKKCGKPLWNDKRSTAIPVLCQCSGKDESQPHQCPVCNGNGLEVKTMTRDDKIQEVLRKLATGGFLSGSCDTDDAIKQALTALKPLMLEELDKGKIREIIIKHLKEMLDVSLESEFYFTGKFYDNLSKAICAKYGRSND